MAALLSLGLYLLNLGYGFEQIFRPLGQFEFISRSFGGASAHTIPGNRFRGSLLEGLSVPVPANYLRGIDVQKYDFEKGKWSYLLGEHRHGGWYHYYVYAFLVKTPLGTLLLGVLSALLLFFRREYRASLRAELVLLAPSLAILILVSSQTGFNRYFRYVIPALPFLYVSISRVGKAFDLHHPKLRIACLLALTASIVGSLSVFPHSMSYFNLAAGGPLGGSAHLLDANIDWGQDLLELKRFLSRHPEVGSIGLAYFGVVEPELVGIGYEPVDKCNSHSEPDMPDRMPGWYAISVNHVYGYRRFDFDEPDYACFQRFTPVARVGYSIHIYHITQDNGGQVREQQQWHIE